MGTWIPKWWIPSVCVCFFGRPSFVGVKAKPKGRTVYEGNLFGSCSTLMGLPGPFDGCLLGGGCPRNTCNTVALKRTMATCHVANQLISHWGGLEGVLLRGVSFLGCCVRKSKGKPPILGSPAPWLETNPNMRRNIGGPKNK